MLCFRLSVTACSVICLLLLPAPAPGQTASCRLEGFVRDASGAAVSGAVVRAAGVQTRTHLEVSTNDLGLFYFPALEPAEYELTVEAKGFRQAVFSVARLAETVVVLEDLVLERGTGASSEAQETKIVRLHNRVSQATHIVTPGDTQWLPLLERNPLVLAAYQPGVEIAAGDADALRVNGMRSSSNVLMLDGVEVSDISRSPLASAFVAFNADSVREFRVVAAGGTAQYGRSAGAQVELVTSAGANPWSGSAYDYYRNSTLDANEFFANSSGIEKPRRDQHIYGFTASGPVRRGQTYIFGNYQGRSDQRSITRNRTVLTPEAKAGMFRWTGASGDETREYDIVAGDPRGIGIDSGIAGVLALLPEPNNTDLGDGLNTGGFRFDNHVNSNERQFTVRVDQNLSAAHRLRYRHSWGRSEADDWRNDADARFPGRPQGTQEDGAWGNSVAWDWSPSAKAVNEFRFGYSTLTTDFLRPDFQSGTLLVSSIWTDPVNPEAPEGRNAGVYEALDDFSIVRGNHIFKAGFSFRSVKRGRYSHAGTSQVVTFTRADGNIPPANVGPVGSAVDRESFEELYNNLLGRMNRVALTYYGDLQSFQAAGAPRTRDYRFYEHAGFVQDDWKWRENLTFNLGVRYEFYGVPAEQDSLQAALDKAALADASAKIGDFSLQRGAALYADNNLNFAPRFGFAWDPLKSGKFVLRGSYGLFFDRFSGAAADMVDDYTPGFSQDVAVLPNASGTDHRLSDGIPTPPAPGSPSAMLPRTRSVSIGLFDPDLQNARVHQFRLSVEREILGTVLELGYVGTRGLNLLVNRDLNQPRIEEDFLKAFLELQAFRLNLTPIPPSNTLVRIFGSANAATAAIGSATIIQGLVGDAADTVDRQYFSLYPSAGVSDFYLRNFPQFNRFVMASGEGRSYYDSLQVRARRSGGKLKFDANYTWSKSTDHASAEDDTLRAPIDSYDLSLGRGTSDLHRRHVFSSSLTYSPILASDGWLENASPLVRGILGNLHLGVLAVWASGPAFSATSGLRTTGSSAASRANFTGDSHIGSVIRQKDGVYWFSSAERSAFSTTKAGEAGTAGRNIFHGPDYLDFDVALTKQVPLRGNRRVVFRAEVYNALNRANFGIPGADLSDPAGFGKISSTLGTPRTFQMALRFDF